MLWVSRSSSSSPALDSATEFCFPRHRLCPFRLSWPRFRASPDFRSARNNDYVMLLAGLVTGMTPSWWQDKHNAHHRNTNQLDWDGDIEVSVFAFTGEQALETPWPLRFVVKTRPSFLSDAAAHFTKSAGRRPCLPGQTRKGEVPGRRDHIGAVRDRPVRCYPVPLLACMAGGPSSSSCTARWPVSNMGSVFAPNHKGMPVLEPSTSLDYFRHQVLTARNVLPNPVIDFAYGGLNFQIEHHLFPNMPRNRLKQSRQVVEAFCLSAESLTTRPASGGLTGKSSAICTRSRPPSPKGPRGADPQDWPVDYPGRLTFRQNSREFTYCCCCTKRR